ncbi:phage tail protein [Streptomyces telluris]|uniref:Phage tail protein n=1 Tax=Streptomyces telluris TaxID=2720021 RepID=A0A9X2LFX4_9ACTN|nr:phage tail protein [Streptomyces telluris]MCQ8770438.1 phage tail protein [Streptomyces telluris]NJP81517.1 phage tail protein [Streptomyces telluris]
MIGDTFVANRFAVELGQYQVATYQSVSGLQVGLEAVGTKQVAPNGDLLARKQSGPRATGEITLSRAMDQDTKWLDWVNASAREVGADTARTNISIALLDSQKKVAQRFHLTNAWAKDWSGPGLDASSSEPSIERVTIAYEAIAVE